MPDEDESRPTPLPASQTCEPVLGRSEQTPEEGWASPLPYGPAHRVWHTFRKIVADFIADDALNRGAAIAFYATTALVPILFIIVSIVGMLFGPAAARGALKSDVAQLIGPQAADLLQAAIKNAAYTSRGLLVNTFSVATLIFVASGFFSEMRTALNVVFGVDPSPTTPGHLLRMAAESLVLIALLAALLLISMLITTSITLTSPYLAALHLPVGPVFIGVTNIVVTWVLTAALFAAIYRILPNRHLPWHDVAVGGIITALLFQLGQISIAFYLARSATVSVYGAAGSLMALLLWIFYSAEIFLFGAEVTKVYTEQRHHWKLG